MSNDNQEDKEQEPTPQGSDIFASAFIGIQAGFGSLFWVGAMFGVKYFKKDPRPISNKVAALGCGIGLAFNVVTLDIGVSETDVKKEVQTPQSENHQDYKQDDRFRIEIR